jgi:secondary thiamine-phosphate synthase enzyme
MRSRARIRVLDEPWPEEPGTHVKRAGPVTFWAETLKLRTQGSPEFIDITDSVAEIVGRSEVTQGWVSVFSKHTTAAVVINENEPLLLEDMKALLTRLAGPQAAYQHDELSRRTGPMDADECANGHAHCQHLLLPTSETIPIAAGKMDLGRWQRVFFVELDRPRDREIVIQVFGA